MQATEKAITLIAPFQQLSFCHTNMLGRLSSAGIAAEKISQSTNKQWMQFDVSAFDLETLLNTKYHIYEHTETGKLAIACDEYVNIKFALIGVLISFQIPCPSSYPRARGLYYSWYQACCSF